MPKILIVEDDKYLCEIIRDKLLLDKHNVDICHDGREGLYFLLQNQYELAILDWNLPNLSGIDILKEYRAAQADCRILMLTGRTAIDEKEAGFNSGADDYLTKPFHVQELLARVRALLRRSGTYVSDVLRAGEIELNTSEHTVTRGGARVHLMPKEYALLEFFVRHPNQVFSPEALLQRVWETDTSGGLDSVRSVIKRLRKKLDGDREDSVIENVFGAGYKFRSDLASHS